YKYANFFITSLDQLLNTNWRVPEVILPLGISFYTFTQTAYLVDAYRGKTQDYNLITYSLFVTFFPHLIAGPILDEKDVLPQFNRLRNFV
ncbi:MAG TPA: membrane-bound O-acyltransferase family protein, partial [Cyanobacteria bacterium UBA8543]|nr:membrane-bound O-acyltransferase family protein [Cyanobacteria bacterium UBA8543]